MSSVSYCQLVLRIVVKENDEIKYNIKSSYLDEYMDRFMDIYTSEFMFNCNGFSTVLR
jgi:hypothetical protein